LSAMFDGYSVMACVMTAFFVLGIEKIARKGTGLQWSRGSQDRGSSDLCVVFYVCAIAFPIYCAASHPPEQRYPAACCCAFVCIALGWTVRFSSMRTLGAFFSRTLKVEGEQKVVCSGLYQYIRHPGYLAVFLVLSGYTFVMANGWLPAQLGVTLLFAAIYSYRMRMEEAMMLQSAIGKDYAAYMRRVPSRLVPFVPL